MIDPRTICVVVQGPVIGAQSDAPEDRHTARCLDSVREYLPGAQIIFSTWHGSDTAGLDYDLLIENDDPGTYTMGDFSANAVRQVVSSQGGIRTCDRKYTLKLRSDVILKHANFLRYYEQYADLPRDIQYTVLQQRVALLTTCNPRRRSKFPYNPSDWFYFGLTADIKKIFESPAIPDGQQTTRVDRTTGESRVCDSPYSPEQYIWFSFLARHRSIPFTGMDDISHGNIETSERYFANNAILLTARMAGIDWLKYPGAAYAQIPCLSNSGLYTWNEYKRMVNAYAGAHLWIIPNPLEELIYATVYPFRFWLKAHNRSLYNWIIHAVNGENHRRVAHNQLRMNVPASYTPDIAIELARNAAKFNKVVIWGLKSQWHTHRFIFQAYYHVLKKTGVPVIWVEDDPASASIIEPRDLIIVANGMHGKMVPEKKTLADYHLPIRDDVFYCPHEEKAFFLEKLDPSQYVHLQYYTRSAERFPKLYEGVHWDAETRTLYQPWGTNLLPNEFKEPTFNRHRFMFWVGSVWNAKNSNWGNVETIRKFKAVLADAGIRFIHVRFIPNFLNTFLIRRSRIAPAIAGVGQVEADYLPCRMFKNISYGQLGFSNVQKFNEIFVGCTVYDEDVGTMTKNVLALSKEEYLRMVEKQQAICKRYTIAHNLFNVMERFELTPCRIDPVPHQGYREMRTTEL